MKKPIAHLFELGTVLPPASRPRPVDGDRVRGMLLGLAIGDALERGGALRREDPGESTQRAFWLVECLLAHGRVEPYDLVHRFLRRKRECASESLHEATYGVFCRPDFGAGVDFYDAHALAGVAPIVLPHLHAPSQRLWADTAAVTRLTHNNELAVVAALGFAGLLMACLSQRTLPPPAWWLETFVKHARGAETEAHYPACHPVVDYDGPLTGFLTARVRPALASSVPTSELCERWGSGESLLEVVPCALALLTRHGAEPDMAMHRAAEGTQAHRLIGALVGAALGALHGVRALPARWRVALDGRVDDDDDERIFELIDATVARFVDRNVPYRHYPRLSEAQKQRYLEVAGYPYEGDAHRGSFHTDRPGNRPWDLSPWIFSYEFDPSRGYLFCELYHRMTNNCPSGWDHEGNALDAAIVEVVFPQSLF